MDVDTGVGLQLDETQAEQLVAQTGKPVAPCLLETIDAFPQEQTLSLWTRVTRGEGHVYLLVQDREQKSIVDIELVELPTLSDSVGHNDSKRLHESHCCKSLVVVQTMLLLETTRETVRVYTKEGKGKISF
jgi:hypothetical protein